MAASEKRRRRKKKRATFFFLFFGEDSPPFFGRGYASAKKYNHPTARDTPRRMCRCLLTWINKRPASLISDRLPRNFRRLKNSKILAEKQISNWNQMAPKTKNLSTEGQKKKLRMQSGRAANCFCLLIFEFSRFFFQRRRHGPNWIWANLVTLTS